jgi:phosphatidylserine/phosphatidylglycerophosphate/cardiolipin synthase-like enzyme
MVEQAERTIDVGYFILEKDVFGYAYLGHLLKKAREGKRVRVQTDAMADTFGQRGFKATFRGQDYLQELVEGGAEVKIYHPITWRLFEIFSRDFMASNHDKILVVDGKLSSTGGRNIAWDYYAHPDDNAAAWRDTDVHLSGEGPARGLTEAFEVEFNAEGVNYTVKKDLFGNWRPRDIELLGAYAMMDAWIKGPTRSETEKATLRTSEAARRACADQLVADAVAALPGLGITRKPNGREREALRELALELAGHPEHAGAYRLFDGSAETHPAEVKILDKTSEAGLDQDGINKALIALAEKAEKRIVIENPYVVLTEAMIVALEAAAKRGVEVIIGTNSPLSTDSTMTQAFFLEDWAYVMARIPNLKLYVATGTRKLHAKCAFFDDDLAIVSTYNMDFLSAYVNGEVAAVMWSPGMVDDLMQSFVDDRDEPRNGVLEYKILRDAQGRAILEDGAPQVLFGPEDHLSKEILEEYEGRRKRANFIRTLPWFEPLRHPPLVPVTSGVPAALDPSTGIP